MSVTDWCVSAPERHNPATELDRRHGDGATWTAGNDVMPLVHGSMYFRELLICLKRVRADDLVLFTDWRGDPDQALDDDGTQVSQALCEAAVPILDA
jgi:hypothetical protein